MKTIVKEAAKFLASEFPSSDPVKKQLAEAAINKIKSSLDRNLTSDHKVGIIAEIIDAYEEEQKL